MPTMNLSPTSVARGPSPAAIGVTGSGYAAGERLSILVGRMQGAAVNADLAGNLAASIPNPAVTLGAPATIPVSTLSANGAASAFLTVT
jgi:hypothetical protein